MVDLLFGTYVIGTVENAECCDYTWQGEFRLQPAKTINDRVLAYIEYCKQWNERLRSGENADPAEFGKYSDIVESGGWSAKHEGGSIAQIEDAPVFFNGGDVSWREK